MQKQIIIILMLGLITACHKYSDPYIKTLVRYSFEKSGSDQRAFAGNYLNDSISLQIINSLNYSTEERMQVQFEVIKGGGEVDHSTVITDSVGFAYTKWKLGEKTCEQTVLARIFDPSDKLLSDIRFRAFGFRHDTWDTIQLKPDKNIYDMVADTVNNLTFMTTNNTLYKQGDNYFDWEELNTINIKFPCTIEIDSEGTLYVGNWSGELSKSTDGGRAWITCSKPIPDYSGYFHFVVSSDKYIWVTTNGYALRCSRDGGETWTIDSIGLAPNELLGYVFRLSNGTLLFHSLNHNLYKSEDDGKTWSPVQTPEYSIKLYVTVKDEIILCNQLDGFSIYKSTDLGKHFHRVYQVWPEYGFLMDHVFHKFKGFYYVLVPGYGILKTGDFNTFEVYWRNTSLNNLFMDHNGALIAKDWNRDEVYYRKNSD
jgi:photosystem II stability/assembly factor-like uncharacterized protein